MNLKPTAIALINTILLLLYCCAAYGQASQYLNAAPDSTEKPNSAVTILENVAANRSFELTLSFLVIGFGVVVLGIEAYLASKGLIQPDHILKCIVITLVIIGSLLLVSAGYSQYQINGITGLLGSIAGYLLAKNDSTTNNKTN